MTDRVGTTRGDTSERTKMTLLRIRVTPRVVTALDDLADEWDTTRSEALRRAVLEEAARRFPRGGR